MIKINRSQATPNIPVYVRAMTRGRSIGLTQAVREYNESIDFHTNVSHYLNEEKITDSKFKFNVYKDKELVAELGKIFGNKCAYCESCFGAVTPKDIEHFRPKSEIKTHGEAILRPGYYWLAAEWLNLLVSCPDCNRRREHEVPGQPAMVNLGKDIQFPIADENARLRVHSCSAVQIANEEAQRLLINPCIEDPEDYFIYDDEGLIHPRNANDMKAICSIHVYALQRKALVEARKATLVRLQRLFFHLCLPVKELTQIPLRHVNKRVIKQNQITELMNDVLDMFEPEKPYLGLLRDYIRRHVASGTYREYRTAGIRVEDLLRLPVSRSLPVPRLNPSTFRNMTSRIPVGLRLR